MRHSWRKIPDINLSGLLLNQFSRMGFEPRSETHQCENCGAVTLSEVGGEPDEDVAVMGTTETCEEATARRVLES